MSRLRYLNPFRIRKAVQDIKRVSGGGGPKRLRLVCVGHPEGWVLPTAEVVIEVEAKDGTVETFAPAFPVPWPYAWAWRLARKLNVPLVRSYEPDKLSFGLPVPRRK